SSNECGVDMNGTARSDHGTNGGSTRPPLLPAELEKFARIGVDHTWLAAAGIRHVSDIEARNDYGIQRSDALLEGIIYPYLHPVTGERVTARLRRTYPDLVDGKIKNKYLSPYRDNRHLYFPTGAALLPRDASVP